MLNYVIMGVVLGASAGFAPGPLFTLVIAETLRHGLRSGVFVAMAPLVTDLPIICIAVFFLSQYAQTAAVLGGISLLGGGFVFYLGIENFRIKKDSTFAGLNKANSFKKAIIANTLSPHPYLFWISVGAPAVIKSSQQNYIWSVAFVLSFYLLFVSAKIFLAIVTVRSKKFLVGKSYRYIMKMIGLALWGLAGALVYDGFKLLKFI